MFTRHLPECPTCAQEVREFRETAARLAAAESAVPGSGLRALVLTEVSATRQFPPAIKAPSGARRRQGECGDAQATGRRGDRRYRREGGDQAGCLDGSGDRFFRTGGAAGEVDAVGGIALDIGVSAGGARARIAYRHATPEELRVALVDSGMDGGLAGFLLGPDETIGAGFPQVGDDLPGSSAGRRPALSKD
ncbi:MAG TPA: hypothetical protein VFG15_27980 [Amycolatopsis sp.]|nr:hypothetical protein [Amycolatopsis sp.]